MSFILSRKANTSSGHDVAGDGKHGHTAVLELDEAKTIKAILIGVIKKTQRIPETKRWLGASLLLESHLQRRGTSNTGHRGECGS